MSNGIGTSKSNGTEIHREKIKRPRGPLKTHVIILSILFFPALGQLRLLQFSSQSFDFNFFDPPVSQKTIGKHGPIMTTQPIYTFHRSEINVIQSMLQERNLSQRSFVCITGQVERLELEDKVLNLLDPLRRAGVIPDIALVLTESGVPRFTNDGFVGGQIYSSYNHASDYIQSQGYNVLSSAPFQQSEHPQVSQVYIDKMGDTKFNFLPADRKKRAQNHYRQYESLRQCGILYKQANTNYAFAIRAREDLGFRLEIWNGTTSNLTSVMTDLYQTPKTILSTDCRAYDGINDRFAWVSPAAAADYFITPLASMVASRVPNNTRNPETFLMHSYLNVGINVILSARLRGLIKVKISKSNTTEPSNDNEWKGMFCPEDYPGHYALTYRDPTKKYPKRFKRRSTNARKDVATNGRVTVKQFWENWRIATRDPPVYQFHINEMEKVMMIVKKHKHSRKCFICITGQVERLELEEKVLHLLNPLRLAGLTPEVALVLTESGIPRYTNYGFDGGQIYPTYQHASDYIQSQGYKVLSRAPFQQSEYPQVSQVYIDKMGNTTVNFLPADRANRAQNHYRQYESLNQCGALYNEAKTNYAFAIRAREDLGFRLEIWNGTTSNLTSVLTDLYRRPKTILTTDCRAYDGINDRFAWVSPAAAGDYFATPLAHMVAKYVPHRTRNPETFLMRSYLNANITVILTARLRGLLKVKILKDNTTRPATIEEWKGMFCPEDIPGHYALTYRIPTKRYLPRDQIISVTGISSQE